MSLYSFSTKIRITAPCPAALISNRLSNHKFSFPLFVLQLSPFSISWNPADTHVLTVPMILQSIKINHFWPLHKGKAISSLLVLYMTDRWPPWFLHDSHPLGCLPMCNLLPLRVGCASNQQNMPKVMGCYSIVYNKLDSSLLADLIQKLSLFIL